MSSTDEYQTEPVVSVAGKTNADPDDEIKITAEYENYTYNECDNLHAMLAHQTYSSLWHKEDSRDFLIIAFGIVLLVGIGGCLLVIVAVARKAAMRTPRNLFIMNLAVSDLIFCTVTVPSTLYSRLYNFWVLGRVLCNLLPLIQAVNVVLSTFCITGIGLDRFFVIIYPTSVRLQRVALVVTFTMIWLMSFILALPMYFGVDYESLLAEFIKRNMTRYLILSSECGFANEYWLCVEKWDHIFIGKIEYTLVMFVFQYLLPLATLLFVYAKIVTRLRARSSLRSGMIADRQRRLENNQRRTMFLLFSIVIFFAIEWLPFNVYMMLLTFKKVNENDISFLSCYLAASLSASVNPIIYGVFNENFRVEFAEILHTEQLCVFITSCLPEKWKWKRRPRTKRRSDSTASVASRSRRSYAACGYTPVSNNILRQQSVQMLTPNMSSVPLRSHSSAASSELTVMNPVFNDKRLNCSKL